MSDLIDREEAIKRLKMYGAEHNAIAVINGCPSAEPEKTYTKADYIFNLHKEYGCTLAVAEEAHNKALEFLRNKSMVRG